MTNFTIGDLGVSRVEEVLGPGFQPNVLLPDWNKAAIESHLSWLVPNYYDAVKDRLVSSLHSWVIRTKHHTILIDTCAGNHKERPSMPRFHMLDRPYLANLKAAGVDPAKVDFVLCTHLHIDHVGWNTRLDNGRWVPTFPNAKYVFSKVDRDYFNADGGVGGKSGEGPKIWADSILPVIASGQAMAVDMTHKLGDGLLIEPAPGHSPGHVVLRAQSKGEEALFVGDVLHHPMQIYETAWSPDEIVSALAAERGAGGNAIERFALWLKDGAVAVCGNGVNGFSGVTDLGVVLLILGAFGYILFRLARKIFVENP